ncbi:MAG: hypothetical protein NVS9B4_05020 [Candidatus Acidiferrum sp.]
MLVLLATGCQQHPLTDYRPVDQAGMYFGSVEQLKGLNTSDAEVAELVVLKRAGVSDETCLALVGAAHQHHHPFTSAESVANLARASFSDLEMLDIARADQLDTLSTDAITLRLVGLSNDAVQKLMHRRLQGQPGLSSGAIARLKNTGLTEKEILWRVDQGMTDAQADKEASSRENARNHYGTGFVRVHGRRPR